MFKAIVSKLQIHQHPWKQKKCACLVSMSRKQETCKWVDHPCSYQNYVNDMKPVNQWFSTFFMQRPILQFKLST